MGTSVNWRDNSRRVAVPVVLTLVWVFGAPTLHDRRAQAVACPSIHERLIPFGNDRRALSLEYVRAHYDSTANDILVRPEMIVVHWTVSPSVDEAYAVFAPAELAASRGDISRGGELNVSAHYLVDRQGVIYRLMPDSLMARHVIGLNRVAIGIENVGGESQPLTQAQAVADVALIRCLRRAHPSIRYLIGHFEYEEFRGTPLWQERDSSYFTVKHDPGAAFMTEVRTLLGDSTLLSRFQPNVKE
jgi:N-acetylmuramoyl-L-alanine amidase